MRAAVIDTSVPVTANGRDVTASPYCTASCARAIGEICRSGHLVLDSARRIIIEYCGKLHPGGQPGPGDEFLKWVLINEWNPARCCRIPVTPRIVNGEDYEEFPDDPDLASFHHKDRKFVAVSRAHSEHPPILVAVDTDWWDARKALKRHDVRLEFLCEAELRATARLHSGRRQRVTP